MYFFQCELMDENYGLPGRYVPPEKGHSEIKSYSVEFSCYSMERDRIGDLHQDLIVPLAVMTSSVIKYRRTENCTRFLKFIVLLILLIFQILLQIYFVYTSD